MFAWILILGAWVALLLLILHDATADDSDGSAVWIAGRTLGTTLGALIDRAKLKALALRKAPREAIPPSPSEPPATAETADEPGSSSSEAPQQLAESPQQAATAQIEQTSVPAPSKKRWWRKDGRAPITIAELESAIAEAVRNAEPHCEAFVGVIVRQAAPQSRYDRNWQIQGIKFGKADRKVASEALAAVVERMQRDFRLADD
jgi:hypothetical protein